MKMVRCLIILTLLSSCHFLMEEREKIVIFSNLNNTYLDIDNDFLNEKMMNKDNFVLYLYSNSCDSCKSFKPIINNYINETKVNFYAIDVLIHDLFPNNSIIQYEYTPSIAIIRNGEVFKLFNIIDNSKMFSSSTNLKSELEQYIKIVPYFCLNSISQLNETINNKGIIYYNYNLCGDCAFFHKYKFNDYLTKIKFDLYSFELSNYFKDLNMFYEFSKEYGLAYDGTFGYKKGVVPMFVYYENGIVKDTCVIFNDEFEVYFDEKGEIDALELKSSYYDDNPFINHLFYRDSEVSAKTNYYKQTIDYYFDKMIDFFKKFVINNDI